MEKQVRYFKIIFKTGLDVEIVAYSEQDAWLRAITTEGYDEDDIDTIEEIL